MTIDRNSEDKEQSPKEPQKNLRSKLTKKFIKKTENVPKQRNSIL